MKITKEDLISIIVQFNPWWKHETIPDLPDWHRAAFTELMQWIESPPAQRAVLLFGPRQVGKTTLLLQKRNTPGLFELAQKKPMINCGYVVTKSPDDLGFLENPPEKTLYIKIPASLLCYWLGKSEFQQKNIFV